MRAPRAVPVLAAGLALASAATLGAPARPARAATALAEAHLPVGGAFDLTGHGYGHGRGMSQYGAYGAALDGLSAAQILGFYYPGTASGQTGDPTVRVLLSSGVPGTVTVAVPARDGALTVTDHAGAGRSLALPTAVSSAPVTGWRAVHTGAGLALQGYWSGAWRGYSGWTTAGALSFSAASGVIALTTATGDQRDYRGALEAVPTSTGLTPLNLVPRESYLRSVVPSEMPASWAAAAVQAQAVAARTYEADVASPAAAQDICDSQACQVYSGVADYTATGVLVRRYESAASDAAVAATAGQVRTYRGAPILAQFSSSDGGWTVAGGEPYLPAQPDPYDGVVASTANTWTATVSAAALGAAAGVGTATELVVTGRDGHGAWGGRVSTVTVRGTAGTASLSGATLAGLLGLRSAWWTAPAGGDFALAASDLDAVVVDGSSGHVEVHRLAAPGYTTFLAHDATALVAPADPADWAFRIGPYDGDGQPDLYAIHLRGTASGRLEVHVLSAATGYRTWLAHVATAQPALPAGQQDDLSLASWAGDALPDLFLVTADDTASGRVEVHVLSAADGYQSFLAHDASALVAAAPGQWSFLVGDAAGAGDLVAVHHSGSTGSGRTEVHVLSAVSGYRTYALHAASAAPLFPAGSTEWAWGDAAADPAGGGAGNLVLLVPDSASGHVDLHVLAGGTGYSTWLQHSRTALEAVAPAQLQTALG